MTEEETKIAEEAKKKLMEEGETAAAAPAEAEAPAVPAPDAAPAA